jgi:hypothetical protein
MYSHAIDTTPGIAHMFRDSYCCGNPLSCARYKVYQCLGVGNVPADLFPHEHCRLAEILP